MICTICNKEYSVKGLGTHIWRSHGSGIFHKAGQKKGCKIWNKGLTKETNLSVKNASETFKKSYSMGLIKLNHHIPTQDERKATSIRQSLHNSGGKCKWYEVTGIKVQGTWERNVAIKLNELQISWIKPKVHKDVIEYEINGKIKRYTPDFYLPDLDLFIEVKGYWWGRDKEKMSAVISQHPDKRIIIMTKDVYHKFLNGEQVW